MRVLCTLLCFVFIRNNECAVRTALHDKILSAVRKNVTKTMGMMKNAYGDEVYSDITIQHWLAELVMSIFLNSLINLNRNRSKELKSI